MESESSGWLMEFTNLPPLDDKRRLRRNWSVHGFRKRGKLFRQKWSLPLSWIVGSQTIRMDHKMNWFTIQPRSLMNLMIQSSKTYLNRTASWNLKVSLFKDTKVYINSSSQSHKGNDMNCCCVKKSSEFSYVAVLKTTKSLAITFSTHSNICQLWRISIRNPFPNICINSPVKAYFDYVRKPFQVVTMNNICIIGPSCCTFSVGKIVAT